MVFSELNLLDRAINLAYFELIGDASLVNKQLEKYLEVTPEKIQQTAASIFSDKQCSVLYYLKNQLEVSDTGQILDAPQNDVVNV